MRQFKLVNSEGTTYELATASVLFHTVTGLGTSKSNTYRNMGNRFNLVNINSQQVNISGTITFFGESPYADFRTFREFLSKGTLTFLYCPYGDEWFSKDVDLASLEKGELDLTGALNCSLSFTPKTPWYKKVVEEMIQQEPTIPDEPEDDKYDAPVFDWTWPIRFGQSENLSVEIQSDTTVPSPIRMEIKGPLVNPEWVQYVDGNFKTSGMVNITLTEDQKLVVSNTGDNTEIAVYSLTDKFIKDVYQFSDFATDRFMWLRNGRNVVSISSSAEDYRLALKVEAFLYYDTV